MRYLEDFVVGEILRTPSAAMPEEETLAFAAKYDPQAMHLDHEAALEGPLGGISASGWHTAAVVMRLIVEADVLLGGPILGLGVEELNWPAPTRPGDVISADLETVSITPSRSRPTHGVVRIRVTARNQDGATVLTMTPKLWVARRPEQS